MGCAGSAENDPSAIPPPPKSRRKEIRGPNAKTIVATPPEDAIEVLPSEDVTSETAAWCRKRYLFHQDGAEQRALEDLERSRSSAGRGSLHSRGGRASSSQRSSVGGQSSSSPTSSARFGGRSRHSSDPSPSVALETGGALERLLTPQPPSPLIRRHSRTPNGSAAQRGPRSSSPEAPPLRLTASVMALVPPNVFDLLESAGDDDDDDAHSFDHETDVSIVRPLRTLLSQAHLPIPALVVHGEAEIRSPSSSMPMRASFSAPLPHQMPSVDAASGRASPSAVSHQRASPRLEALGAKLVALSLRK